MIKTLMTASLLCWAFYWAFVHWSNLAGSGNPMLVNSAILCMGAMAALMTYLLSVALIGWARGAGRG